MAQSEITEGPNRVSSELWIWVKIHSTVKIELCPRASSNHSNSLDSFSPKNRSSRSPKVVRWAQVSYLNKKGRVAYLIKIVALIKGRRI